MKEIERAKRILEKAKEFIVFDVETTGFSATENQIIQLSAIKVNSEMKIIDKFQTLIKPLDKLPEDIKKITGFTDEDFRHAPEEENIANDIVNFFGTKPLVVGHNIPFDNRFLQALYERAGYSYCPISLDTLKMSKEACEKPHRLSVMIQRFNIVVDGDFHNADTDVLATFELLKKFIS